MARFALAALCVALFAAAALAQPCIGESRAAPVPLRAHRAWAAPAANAIGAAARARQAC